MKLRDSKNPKALAGVPFWLNVRKETTPVHWAYGGLLTWGMGFAFGFAAVVFMVLVFAMDEKWNDWELLKRQKLMLEHGFIPAELYLPEGCTDWWESFFMFGVVAVAVIILQCLGITHMTWWQGAF